VTALPVLSGRELVRRLQRFGYAVDRQSGSRIILRQSAAPYRRLTVPKHREIAKGTLRPRSPLLLCDLRAYSRTHTRASRGSNLASSFPPIAVTTAPAGNASR
jgi:predicted RNA binding protein YcfA (HicA-like mRNA interferase family)